MGEFELSDTAEVKFYDLNGNEIKFNKAIKVDSSKFISANDYNILDTEITIPFHIESFNTKILYPINLPRKVNLTYEITRLVQARTHHKKRINKKWLKRYGYKEVKIPFEIKDVELKTMINNQDGTYTFEGRRRI